MKIAACLYVRNAEQDIQEWIAYHRVLGVNSFLIYDNGSEDKTVQNAVSLKPFCDVRIVPWGHDTSPRSQGNAYEHCLAQYQNDFDWILFLDSDEFLVNINQQSLSEMLQGRLSDGLIALNWACFGSNGHAETPTGLTTEAFTKRSDTLFGPNKHTKVIVQPILAKRYINPHYFDVSGRTVRPDGRDVEWESPGITKNVELLNWYVAHFFVRSKQQWANKITRGYRDIVRDAQLFSVYDRNEIIDENLSALGPKVVDLQRNASAGSHICHEIDRNSHMKPSMTSMEYALFISFLRQASSYVEFGGGGSTYVACQHVKSSVVTVDSSSEWLGKLHQICANDKCKIKPILTYADIGPIGPWGWPADQSCRKRWPSYYEAVWNTTPESLDADLYLIDGRFRVACFMQAILHCRPDSLIMVHDFSSRPSYHIIRNVAREVATAEDFSVFVPSHGSSRRDARILLDRFRFEAG